MVLGLPNIYEKDEPNEAYLARNIFDDGKACRAKGVLILSMVIFVVLLGQLLYLV
jgi:hypothetical protein